MLFALLFPTVQFSPTPKAAMVLSYRLSYGNLSQFQYNNPWHRDTV